MESANCQVGEVERCLEMGPQELGLQDSPCRPLEPPSQTVKEESDMEQELGEEQFSYSWWCVMLSGELWLLGDCG